MKLQSTNLKTRKSKFVGDELIGHFIVLLLVSSWTFVVKWFTWSSTLRRLKIPTFKTIDSDEESRLYTTIKILYTTIKRLYTTIKM